MAADCQVPVILLRIDDHRMRLSRTGRSGADKWQPEHGQTRLCGDPMLDDRFLQYGLTHNDRWPQRRSGRPIQWAVDDHRERLGTVDACRHCVAEGLRLQAHCGYEQNVDSKPVVGEAHSRIEQIAADRHREPVAVSGVDRQLHPCARAYALPVIGPSWRDLVRERRILDLHHASIRAGEQTDRDVLPPSLRGIVIAAENDELVTIEGLDQRR